MEAISAAPFAERAQYLERLRQGPGVEAQAASASPSVPPPRWTLKGIRATFEKLHGYSLSGVRRFLHAQLGVQLRSGRVQQFSPDPEYARKVQRLKRCLRHTRREPRKVRCVFLDEMGFARWPQPAPDWAEQPPAAAPLADRRGAGPGLWRLIAALDAWTGRVTYLDNYIVGREKVIQFYGRLAAAYPRAERIYVVQDNWSIHTHDDVLRALERWPKIQPLWLPTYAPWLNPIEKLWKWLRQKVLHLHRLADDWPALQRAVRGFLDQFHRGSRALLNYVGLRQDGQLARCLRGQTKLP